MKISLKLIKKLTDINISEEELIAKIKSQIGAVEEVIHFREKYQNIVLAKIVERQDHPEAEKLAVYQINIGEKENVQVVAGDKNLEVNDLVAYFKPGAKVPFNPHPEKYDGIIRAVELRGIKSNGMLASARELDINANHERVIKIETDHKPGTPIDIVLDMDDTVIDIENKALTNRGDCFGLIGIAREIAGVQNIPFTSPEWMKSNLQATAKSVNNNLPLEIKNEVYNLCPRYSATTISNITVKESPVWMQSILVKLGLRPINNIVDITNYIMVFTGQPLHAFDYDKLRNKDNNGKNSAHITIRLAKEGEKLNGLNQNVYDLHDTNLVICDSTNPIALAGMLGGADTEIDESTKNIVIECANFDMYNNRKSSMLLGIMTDAVSRYSRGQDPALTVSVMKEASKLVLELAGGSVETEYDLAKSDEIGKTRLITINIEEVNNHLGTELATKVISQLLDNVELHNSVKGDVITVTIPSFRNDVRIKEDIYEEIGRLYGFDNIKVTLPKRDLTPPIHNKLLDLKWKIREILSKTGVDEISSYSFVSKDLLTKYNLEIEESYRLINSLSPELEQIRTSLVPSLLEVAKKNLNSQRDRVVIYEINKTHRKTDLDRDSLPIELEEFAFVLSLSEQNAKDVYNGSSYYLVKNYLEEMLSLLNLPKIQFISPNKINKDKLPTWIKSSINMYDSNAVAVIYVELSENQKEYLGVIGEISPQVKAKVKLSDTTGAFQLDLIKINECLSNASKYQEPSKYPSTSFDICFKVDRDVPYDVINNLIEKCLKEKKLSFKVEPKDIYMSEFLEKEDKRHITFSIKVSDITKTIDSKEVERIIKKISDRVQRETKAVVV